MTSSVSWATVEQIAMSFCPQGNKLTHIQGVIVMIDWLLGRFCPGEDEGVRSGDKT
jgi:hypothetical protein